MKHTPELSSHSRRQFLLGGSALAAWSMSLPARADASLSAQELGISANTGSDVSAALQKAIDQAAARGVPLFLSGGTYRAEGLTLPDGTRLVGLPGATRIFGYGNGPVLMAENAKSISLEGIAVESRRQSADSINMVRFQSIGAVLIRQCQFSDCGGNGLRLDGCGGHVSSSWLSGFGRSAIHAQDSVGLVLADNQISDCDNGGIRVWRSTQGSDGTIVKGNRISAIGSQSGNGQNGNGVNVFRADEVIVADNHISDCDFSAVRLNTTNNTIVRGNMCTNLREVAIFSEFTFSGSIIADNLIDEAAFGISMTNFKEGGRLAICSGNIVRNIWPSSPTNPDTRPVGIMVQADASVTGNAVENVEGVGIAAGWGPYLRDVVVANNSITNCILGIGISVAEGAGNAHVAGNLIAKSEYRAISGMAWTDPKGEELATNPKQFANITVDANTVS